MIEIGSEVLIPLRKAASLVPPARDGLRTHHSTLIRWILDGARDPHGEAVRLEAIRIGNRWLTSREALQRFMERLTPNLDAPAPPAPRTPGRRRRASARAGAELEKMGV
jgi:hypothetical protein